MAKSRTITFDISGTDNLSRVLANAQKNLQGLTSKTLNAQNKALQNAQANLKQVEAYKKLQAAIQNNQASLNQARADQSKFLRQRQDAVAQLSDMRKAYAQLKDAYKANWLSMPTDAALAMKGHLRDAAKELKAQEQVVKNLDKAYDVLPKKTRDLQTQLATQQAQLTQLRTSVPTGNIAAAESALRAQIQQTTQALNAEIAALERRNQIYGNFTTRGQELSNAYSNFQNSLDTAKTLMSPFAQASQNAMTFEKAMSRLKSLTQMRNLRSGDMATVNQQMAEMEATIERLGMTTEYTSNQIAGAANFYAMSGWSPKQINAMLSATTDLASIAQIPIDRVADMLSDDMTAFGVKAGEGYKLAGGKVVDGAKYFGDAVAYATTQSNMDMSTFHESWKYNAPVAKAMQLSLGETVAQNMMLANAGIKGSMSGTSLRQFWVRLSAPPKAAAKSLEELGYAANDAAAQVAETQLAMQEAGATMDSDLFTKITKLRDFYREGKAAGRDMTGWLKGLSGQTALSGVMSLFEGDALDNAMKAAREIDSGSIAGWSAETAAIMRDNTQTQIDYMTSALDALQRAGGEALLPAIRGLAEGITPIITSFAEFTKQNPHVVQGLAAIATTASAAMVSIAGFSLAMAGVRFAQAGFATAGLMFESLATKAAAIRGVLSSFGAGLVTRIGAIGTALSGLTFANVLPTLAAGMRAFGVATLSAARAGLMFVASPIGLALLAIGAAALYAYQNWDRVSAAFSNLSGVFAPIEGAVGRLGSALSGLWTSLSPLASVFESIGGVIIGALVGALGTIGSLVSGVVVLVSGLINSVAELGTGLFDAFGKMKEGDFSGAFEALATSASNSAESFKNSWLEAADAVKSGLQSTDAAIQSLTAPPDVSSHVALGAEALPSAWNIDTTQITQPIADASTQTANSLLQVQAPADMTGQSLLMLPPSIDAASAASDQLSAALPTPIGGLDALGGAASSAAGALEAAAARINSVQINPVITVHAAVTTPAVAHNAKGGIYSKGSFLTTFAENSAEAAIPLDNSARSRDLWLETGSALGMFDGSPPINLSLTFNIAGNADVNQLKSEVVPVIERTFAEQLREYNHERRRRSFV